MERSHDQALVMDGVEGAYEFVNGTYEPMGTHNARPYWSSRNLTSPCKIFHNKGKRWVISKEVDDGSLCYAFITDKGAETPGSCGRRWEIFDTVQQAWAQDERISCELQAASTDPFLRLKAEVDQELSMVGVSRDEKLSQLWRTVDRNGDGTADLQEVQAMIKDMTSMKLWPDFLCCDQSVIERAFANTFNDSDDNCTEVHRNMFHELLANVFWFAKLWDIFTRAAGADVALNEKEFRRCMESMGVQMTTAETESSWKEMDVNANGSISFDEFADHVRLKVCGPGRELRDTADNSLEGATNMDAAVSVGVVAKKKTYAEFERLEQRIKAICNQPSNKGLKKLWSALDFNQNGHVSVAEVDKWLVTQYPLLNHKPAIMRSFQATKNADGKQKGHGADYVQKKEFKLLIVNIFFYNKLFWLFDQADEGNDLRLDLSEFRWCLKLCGVRISPSQTRAEFDKVDTNQGGQILFDEFCHYLVNKRCPELMTSFAEH